MHMGKIYFMQYNFIDSSANESVIGIFIYQKSASAKKNPTLVWLYSHIFYTAIVLYFMRQMFPSLILSFIPPQYRRYCWLPASWGRTAASCRLLLQFCATPSSFCELYPNISNKYVSWQKCSTWIKTGLGYTILPCHLCGPAPAVWQASPGSLWAPSSMIRKKKMFKSAKT